MDYEISEKVFLVKAKPIGDLHLKDVEFEVIVYICPENVAVIKKEDMIKSDNDDDSYYGLITTEIAKQIGVGNVKAQVVFKIHNEIFDKELTDITNEICTGVTIRRSPAYK